MPNQCLWLHSCFSYKWPGHEAMGQFGSCVLQFLLARNQSLMSHLVEVDDCEAVCLSGPHVPYTEEEPLSVLVCVEIKTKVKFIVPSTTGGGGRRVGREGEGKGHTTHTSLSHSTPTLHSYVTLIHHSHTPFTHHPHTSPLTLAQPLRGCHSQTETQTPRLCSQGERWAWPLESCWDQLGHE